MLYTWLNISLMLFKAVPFILCYICVLVWLRVCLCVYLLEEIIRVDVYKLDRLDVWKMLGLRITLFTLFEGKKTLTTDYLKVFAYKAGIEESL